MSNDESTESETADKWLRGQLSHSDPEVTELYHYTNQRGFLGILADQGIWATHVGHLNDKSEVEHAVTMLQSHVRSLRSRTPPRASRLLDWILTTLEGMSAQRTGLFVVSFSANPDSLTQWDRYAQDFGYAMGFDPKRLNLVHRISPTDTCHGRLIRVFYAEDAKQSLISATIDKLLNRADELSVSGFAIDPDWDIWNRELLQCLALLFTALKHEAYTSEDEYRLVVTHDPTQPTSAREGKHGVATYVTLSPDQENDLPLVSVVVGPSHYPEVARFAVQQILVRRLGVGQIRNSNIPKRT